MKKSEQYFLMFLVGGILYGGIEVAFRGFTHWSMVITGGSALLSIYLINEFFPNVSVWLKALAGSAVITAMELTVGLIVNRVFLLGVWDYSHIPANFMGQIALRFSACWYFLSIIGFYLCKKFKDFTALQKS